MRPHEALQITLDKIFGEAKQHNQEDEFMKQMRELAKVDIEV